VSVKGVDDVPSPADFHIATPETNL
jgi:hypothetical protein